MLRKASTASNLQQPRAAPLVLRVLVIANSEAMPVLEAGQLQAESLAFGIMHETHSSISSHLTCFTKYSSLFCYFDFFIFLVHVDEVTIQDM